MKVQMMGALKINGWIGAPVDMTVNYDNILKLSWKKRLADVVSPSSPTKFYTRHTLQTFEGSVGSRGSVPLFHARCRGAWKPLWLSSRLDGEMKKAGSPRVSLDAMGRGLLSWIQVFKHGVGIEMTLRMTQKGAHWMFPIAPWRRWAFRSHSVLLCVVPARGRVFESGGWRHCAGQGFSFGKLSESGYGLFSHSLDKRLWVGRRFWSGLASIEVLSVRTFSLVEASSASGPRVEHAGFPHAASHVAPKG